MQQGRAFLKRFPDQRNIALCKVAHTAVHQLGRTRRGAFGEIMRIHQHHAESAGSGVQCHTQPGSAATDHGDVIGVRLRQPSQKILPAGWQRPIGMFGIIGNHQ